MLEDGGGVEGLAEDGGVDGVCDGLCDDGACVEGELDGLFASGVCELDGLDDDGLCVEGELLGACCEAGGISGDGVGCVCGVCCD